MFRALHLRVLTATLLIAGVPFVLPAGASAAAVHATGVTIPSSGTPGSRVSVVVDVTNTSTAPETAAGHTISNLEFVPSCGTPSVTPSGDCSAPDVGVLEPPQTGVGVAGTACDGTTFSVAPVPGSTTGRYSLTPSEPVVLAAPDNGDSDRCSIALEMTVERLPEHDALAAPGLQTVAIASSVGTSNIAPPGEPNSTSFSAGTAAITVAPAAEPPGLRVDKEATPLSRPEPGGTFAFAVDVTNTSAIPLTLTELNDDVYGDVTTQGTCTTAPGTVLAPGDTYGCAFSGEVTGNAGTSQTDIVTATAVDDAGAPVSDEDDATVEGTDVPPTITVTKTALPEERTAPGGAFTFQVVITNTSFEAVTITALEDDVEGDLTQLTASSCSAAVGSTIAPGAQLPCTFSSEVTGPAGTAQTDVVTVTVADDDGSSATAHDDATVRLVEPGATTTAPSTTAAPAATAPAPTTTPTSPPPTVGPPALARTGGSIGTRTAQALALLGAGLLLTGLAWTRSSRPARRAP